MYLINQNYITLTHQLNPITTIDPGCQHRFFSQFDSLQKGLMP